ncbi:DUF7701 domain-containing protein [Nocardioides sp. Leaf374]|uniref:RipA family octameric membrane protein n=1 Tax=Nocardioides sp. Leaf374 TaxID=2876560 RepID=UPI001E55F399|nr:hypothetical protein [Nocardioides sp. Leaf374]
MYLSDLAAQVRANIPHEMLPQEDHQEQLFLTYAVLARAKGVQVSESDVHDAWAAWMASHDKDHESLVPYDDLDSETAEQDALFAEAIRSVARTKGESAVSRILFSAGHPRASVVDSDRFYDLYKVMVQSSESLVARRQGVNTFFITINGVLLTALGLIGGSAVQTSLGALGIAFLAATGGLLSFAWRSLITSFGQLNTGKFKVINEMERHLGAAIYAAEWEALGRGEDPRVYRSFTSREIWVPNTLVVVYFITVVVAGLVASGTMTIAKNG